MFFNLITFSTWPLRVVASRSLVGAGQGDNNRAEVSCLQLTGITQQFTLDDALGLSGVCSLQARTWEDACRLRPRLGLTEVALEGGRELPSAHLAISALRMAAVAASAPPAVVREGSTDPGPPLGSLGSRPWSVRCAAAHSFCLSSTPKLGFDVRVT